MEERDHWAWRYDPPHKTIWSGHHDEPAGQRFHQIIQCVDLRHELPDRSKGPVYALIGFACEEGIRRNLGRTGAAQGPEALRKAIGQLPVHLKGPYQIIDCGDISCSDTDLEEAQRCLGEVISLLLQHHVHPIVIGGGHEVAWGHYQGIRMAHPRMNLGMVNIDAHFDLRPLLPGKLGSGGTTFLQIAQECKENQRDFDYLCLGIEPFANSFQSFRQAHDLGVHYVTGEEIYLQGPDVCFHALDSLLTRRDAVYLTLCLDVFSSAYAPGVSATQPLGISPWQAVSLIRRIASSGKVLSFDVSELSPPLDKTGLTAQLSASLIATFIHEIHRKVSTLAATH